MTTNSTLFDIILFDADGTLFDFALAERHAYFESFRRFGLDEPSEQIFKRYHHINQSLWDKLERGLVTKEQLAVERHRKTFAEFDIPADPDKFNLTYIDALSHGSFLYDGAEELCLHVRQWLDRRFPESGRLCIVTNGIAQVQRTRFGLSTIHTLFDELFVSESLGYTKPDRRYFDAALDKLGISQDDRRRVLVIGDSLTSDILGANNAGLQSCWYNPAHRELSGSALPDFEADSYSALINLFFT